MQEVMVSLATGFLVGAVFAFFRLPIPAPPTLAAVMGVVGIFLGFLVVNSWLR